MSMVRGPGLRRRARFTGLRHRESLLAVDSKIDAYDLITQRGILSSNQSRLIGNKRLMVIRAASTTRKVPSGSGAMGRAPELRSRALQCRVLCDVSSYGRSVRWETHLRGFLAAGATGVWCATVTTFPWASALAGAWSGPCCPLATGQSQAASTRSPLARHRARSLRGDL
jgi:hypothetical protein